MTVRGTVTHLDFEGGFWGIVADDGAKYRPVDGIPAPFRRDGHRIEATLEPVRAMSIFMWGRSVRIIRIEDATH